MIVFLQCFFTFMDIKHRLAIRMPIGVYESLPRESAIISMLCLVGASHVC